MARILLIEDNEMNRDMLSRRLLRKGYELVLAVDGGEGVAKAMADKPDLILLDMSLPVLDGWEAARLLKSSPQTSSIPIIALTAHAMSGDKEAAWSRMRRVRHQTDRPAETAGKNGGIVGTGQSVVARAYSTFIISRVMSSPCGAPAHQSRTSAVTESLIPAAGWSMPRRTAAVNRSAPNSSS
jgi:CheY-like chemotaxis protein